MSALSYFRVQRARYWSSPSSKNIYNKQGCTKPPIPSIPDAVIIVLPDWTYWQHNTSLLEEQKIISAYLCLPEVSHLSLTIAWMKILVWTCIWDEAQLAPASQKSACIIPESPKFSPLPRYPWTVLKIWPWPQHAEVLSDSQRNSYHKQALLCPKSARCLHSLHLLRLSQQQPFAVPFANLHLI